MKQNTLLKISKNLLIINALFWLFIAVYFSFSDYGKDSYLFIKVLLFLESVFYFISVVGVIKKIKIIYFGAIILSLGNTVLSITDQIDLSDIISLFLSFITFLSLVSLWNIFSPFKVKTK
jgi:lysylphosphatidylglycerol synthetase-like protein (DUF2156 family)